MSIYNKHNRRYYGIIFCFVSMFVLIFSFKILQYQYFKSHELSTIASEQYAYEERLSDLNYLLLDKSGKQLLDYKVRYYAVIDPIIFNKYNLYSSGDNLLALNYILRNYNTDYKLPDMTEPLGNKRIYYPVDDGTFKKLKNITGVKGFYTYAYSAVDRQEAWKIENLITNIKTPQGDKNKEDTTIEAQIYNRTINNTYPKITFYRDKNENTGDGVFSNGENNVNVRLTLDKEVQDKIKEIISNTSYNQVGVVLMEADTGKIMAMTQKDDTLPNVNISSTTEDGFQPGSIFKVIVEEAGLENNSISPNSKYVCKAGKDSLCKEEHGTLTVEEAIMKSCNNIFAALGEKIGFGAVLKNAENQGLFQKVLNFDSEVSGDYVEPIYNAGGARLVSIGQNMRITPLQAISIANTVVNKGVYVKPKILDAYINDNNEALETFNTEKRQVISKKTADTLKAQMINVAKEGTGYEAYIDGIEIGGKTGSTERYDGDKKVSDGWFTGFFKVKDKYYSMVVFVQNIDKEKEAGGNTAAPLFRSIVKSINQNL